MDEEETVALEEALQKSMQAHLDDYCKQRNQRNTSIKDRLNYLEKTIEAIKLTVERMLQVTLT